MERLRNGAHSIHRPEFSPPKQESQALLNSIMDLIGYLASVDSDKGSFGKRLRGARKGRMTQEELGAKLPDIDTGLPRQEVISKGAISQWEGGTTVPTLQAAAAAALALGRSLDYLVFGRSLTLDARIDALPPGFRDEVLKSVLASIESAEQAAMTLPKVAKRPALDTEARVKRFADAGGRRPKSSKPGSGEVSRNKK